MQEKHNSRPLLLTEHGLTLIPAYISNHMSSKPWDEIIYPFPIFNGCIVRIWEWVSNFIPHFIMDEITYPCWMLRLRLIHASKRGPSTLAMEARFSYINPTIWYYSIKILQLLECWFCVKKLKNNIVQYAQLKRPTRLFYAAYLKRFRFRNILKNFVHLENRCANQP